LHIIIIIIIIIIKFWMGHHSRQQLAVNSTELYTMSAINL